MAAITGVLAVVISHMAGAAPTVVVTVQQSRLCGQRWQGSHWLVPWHFTILKFKWTVISLSDHCGQLAQFYFGSLFLTYVMVKAGFKFPGAGCVAFNAGIGQLLMQLVIGLGMAGQNICESRLVKDCGQTLACTPPFKTCMVGVWQIYRHIDRFLVKQNLSFFPSQKPGYFTQ